MRSFMLRHNWLFYLLGGFSVTGLIFVLVMTFSQNDTEQAPLTLHEKFHYLNPDLAWRPNHGWLKDVFPSIHQGLSDDNPNYAGKGYVAFNWTDNRILIDLEDQNLHNIAALRELGIFTLDDGVTIDLSLSKNDVSDIGVLADLSVLETLYMKLTPVRDLSPLSDLMTLKYLHLDYTQVSDLSPLSGVETLKILRMMDTQISDLTPLSGLTSLEYLDVDGSQISDLSALSRLTTLNRLSVSRTQVHDLTPLTNLVALEHLYLHRTQVTDFSPVAHVPYVLK